VLKLDPLEVAFEFAELSTIGIHCIFDAVPLLVDLLDDEFVNQGFVFCSIVGGLVLYL
jgi:hypothetical protein